MKKIVLAFICLLLSVFIYAQDTITLNNGVYRIDTLAHYPIGPGSSYTALQLTRTTGGLLHVYFSKVCRTNPYISFEATVGRDSILLGEVVSSQSARHSYPGHRLFTGTNGDFYATTGDVGLPTSVTVCNGEYAYSPNNSRNVMAFDANFMPMLADRLTFSGTVTKGDVSHAINHVNYKRLADELVLYNRYQGKTTKTNVYGHEATIMLCDGESWKTTGTMQCVVTAVNLSTGSTAIPQNGAVLSAHGSACDFVASLAVGDSISIAMNTILDGNTVNVSNALGGDTRSFMLNNGVVETNINNIWNENHPRTGFGFSQSGDTVIMCVVDGRGVSMGCTTYTLAEIMQSAGAYSAINLDGGGSSTHFVAPFGAMNRTSDGPERAVSNAIFAVNNAPDNDTIAAIAVYYPNVYLPNYGIYTPKVLGYNKYGALINTNVEGFTIICNDAQVGHVENNKFIASGSKSGLITIDYNGVQCSVYVIKVDNADVNIQLDSVIVDSYHPYEVDVNAIIGLNTEKVMGKALSWQVENPAVCEVRDGVIYALTNGETVVYGSLGDFSDSLKVIVENPTGNVMKVEDWNATSSAEWAVSSSSAWKTTLVPATATESASLDFKYATARAPFIKMTSEFRIYGLPDSIGLRLNLNGAALSNLSLSLRPNDVGQAIVIPFENPAANGNIEMMLRVAEVVSNYGSFSIYPMFLETIRFNLNSTNMTVGNDYSIALHGLYLYYGKVVVTATDFTSDTYLDIYPNPTSDFIFVPQELSGKDYSLIDIDGRVISRGVLNGNSINVSGLSKGLYILNVNGKSSKFLIK